jgi:threonine-phosphate decarboxylase
MIEHKDHFHGSDLEKIEAVYGIRKDEIVSFSANVNPLGISKKLRSELSEHIDVITTYPDREYTALRHAIANYCGTKEDHIIVGNGSTELIALFIQITHPAKALILGPTYSEYEREIALEGGRTTYYPLREQQDFKLQLEDFKNKLTDDLDLVVLCNPNNPTSTCISKNDMRDILDVCKEHSIYVMVDETYVEFVDDIASVSAIPLTAYYNNIIILRGTSKFFAAPGLRLGYAITGNTDLLHQINQYKNPWMINSLAEKAGEIMFSDVHYINEARDLIISERKRLYEKYNATSRFKAYAPTANFMLLKILDENESAETLFDRAIREKMMIRDCSTFPFLNDRYIRICFMSPEDNDRLFDCLTR